MSKGNAIIAVITAAACVMAVREAEAQQYQYQVPQNYGYYNQPVVVVPQQQFVHITPSPRADQSTARVNADITLGASKEKKEVKEEKKNRKTEKD